MDFSGGGFEREKREKIVNLEIIRGEHAAIFTERHGKWNDQSKTCVSGYLNNRWGTQGLQWRSLDLGLETEINKPLFFYSLHNLHLERMKLGEAALGKRTGICKVVEAYMIDALRVASSCRKGQTAFLRARTDVMSLAATLFTNIPKSRAWRCGICTRGSPSMDYISLSAKLSTVSAVNLTSASSFTKAGLWLYSASPISYEWREFLRPTQQGAWLAALLLQSTFPSLNYPWAFPKFFSALFRDQNIILECMQSARNVK